MKAGVACTDITPRLGTPLAGSCTLRPARKLVDRLHAKALILEQHGRRCAILTADLLGFDERMVARLRKHCLGRHGIGLLLCNASHTHSGPDSYNEFCDYKDRRALASRRRYQHQLERKLQRLVASAARDLEPIRLSCGKDAANFGVNRRRKVRGEVQHMPNPKGFHDNTVSVFQFATAGNETLAVLFSYACHPTTRSWPRTMSFAIPTSQSSNGWRAPPPLTVLGYTNACRAYIPTRRIRHEGGYEGEWSFYYSVCRAHFSLRWRLFSSGLAEDCSVNVAGSLRSSPRQSSTR